MASVVTWPEDEVAIAGASQNQRVIQIAQPRIVTVVGVHALLFIGGTKDQTRIPILTQKLNVRLDQVVFQMSTAIHRFGAIFVGVVAHGAVDQLPGAAKSLPVISLLKVKRIAINGLCRSMGRLPSDIERDRDKS
jgi:hypothetical protein